MTTTIQDKTYSIRWYGPFLTKEEVGGFENLHPDIKCQLYAFRGLKKHARVNESYYCGQAKKGVFKCLCNKNHHINDLSRTSEIWIGSLSNVRPQARFINHVERIVTATMANCYGKEKMLNVINKDFPSYNIYVINLWHKTNGERLRKYSKDTLPADIPDLLGHEFWKDPMPHHRIYGVEKVKQLDITF